MKNMKWIIVCIVTATSGFANSIVLNNQAINPSDHAKTHIAIQWATSAKAIEDNNTMAKQEGKFNTNALHTLTRMGKINVEVPEKINYFRVIVWSEGAGEPDLMSSWVNIESNKTYTLNKEHLVPMVLLSGSGC